MRLCSIFNAAVKQPFDAKNFKDGSFCNYLHQCHDGEHQATFKLNFKSSV